MAKLQSCLKRIFIFFNILFAVSGCVIVSVGLFWHVFYHKDSSEFTLAVVVGGATIAVSLLGAYGAHREKRIPLVMFLAACFVACFGLLLVTVPAAIYRPEVEYGFEEKLRDVLPLSQASPEVRELAESIQQTFKCCGLFSTSDWGPNVPDSCLCQNLEDEMEDSCQAVQYQNVYSFGERQKIYKQTCFPVLMYYLSKGIDVVLGVLFGFAGLALLGAVMSAVLLAQLSKSTHRVPDVFSVSAPPSKFSWSQPPKYSELYNQPEK